MSHTDWRKYQHFAGTQAVWESKALSVYKICEVSCRGITNKTGRIYVSYH